MTPSIDPANRISYRVRRRFQSVRKEFVPLRLGAAKQASARPPDHARSIRQERILKKQFSAIWRNRAKVRKKRMCGDFLFDKTLAFHKDSSRIRCITISKTIWMEVSQGKNFSKRCGEHHSDTINTGNVASGMSLVAEDGRFQHSRPNRFRCHPFH